MDAMLKVLLVDTSNGFYKVRRYKVGDYFGPVDLGIHMTDNYRSLNIGTGLFAGSIFPGSNRLIFTGYSPCWRGFYISSMGGAGLVFDNLGINMVSIVGKAASPSILYLNRNHGEEIEVEIVPVDIDGIWKNGRKGIYSLMDHTFEQFGSRYEHDPRILATGPGSIKTDFGGICSVPISKGKLTFVDTWAGRGGFGSKLLQDHGIASIIYGGTTVDEDFRDRNVADEWFSQKYQQKLAVKDFESTTKYRFDPKFGTGGTFGVNYATAKGKIIAFNYKTIYMTEVERLDINQKFISEHYLKQFNDESIANKQQATCGEPCSAVCKKMNGEFKKDYEPYQTLGPQCGIFDQRAAEKLNHYCDAMGLDAINCGCVLSWFMELLSEGILSADQLGVSKLPKFSSDGFDVIKDSLHNAEIGIELIDSILENRGDVDLSEGVRKWARKIHKTTGKKIIDSFVFISNGRRGWMAPNQYWTPGVLAPMAIMGKYYMYYGNDFVPPRDLGKFCAERLKQELILDNNGICRFHRGWAEEMMPEIIGYIYGMKEKFNSAISFTASRINSRNAAVFLESERNIDFIHTFLKRKRDEEGESRQELLDWIDQFDKDKYEAALNFWFEIRKGIDESLRDFQ